MEVESYLSLLKSDNIGLEEKYKLGILFLEKYGWYESLQHSYYYDHVMIVNKLEAKQPKMNSLLARMYIDKILNDIVHYDSMSKKLCLRLDYLPDIVSLCRNFKKN